jgi:hypothetical protein
MIRRASSLFSSIVLPIPELAKGIEPFVEGFDGIEDFGKNKIQEVREVVLKGRAN